MFVRQKKNKSGSVSVQIISKSSGKYKVVKTIGSSFDPQKVNSLVDQARFEISRQQRQGSLFMSEESSVVEGFLSTLSNSQVRVIGPEANHKLSIIYIVTEVLTLAQTPFTALWIN